MHPSAATRQHPTLSKPSPTGTPHHHHHTSPTQPTQHTHTAIMHACKKIFPSSPHTLKSGQDLVSCRPSHRTLHAADYHPQRDTTPQGWLPEFPLPAALSGRHHTYSSAAAHCPRHRPRQQPHRLPCCCCALQTRLLVDAGPRAVQRCSSRQQAGQCQSAAAEVPRHLC